MFNLLFLIDYYCCCLLCIFAQQISPGEQCFLVNLCQPGTDSCTESTRHSMDLYIYVTGVAVRFMREDSHTHWGRGLELFLHLQLDGFQGQRELLWSTWRSGGSAGESLKRGTAALHTNHYC